MKRFLLGVMLGICFTSANAANNGEENRDHTGPTDQDEPVELSSGQATAGQGVFEFSSNYGAGAIDMLTRRVYLSTPSGVREYSLDQALSAWGANPAEFTLQDASPKLDMSVAKLGAGGTLMGPCSLSPCQVRWDPVDG